MSIRKQGRYWAILDADGTLVCLCVYRKGAQEVVRRLQALDAAQCWRDRNGPHESPPETTTTDSPELF